MTAEVNIYGIFVPALFAWMMAAYGIHLLLRRGLAWAGFCQLVWHRPLFSFSALLSSLPAGSYHETCSRRSAVTLVMVAIDVVGLALFDYYINAPWTRDGQGAGGYFEETKLSRIHVNDKATVRLIGESQLLSGHVESIAAGIEDRERCAGSTLLENVNPTFSWVPLAQAHSGTHRARSNPCRYQLGVRAYSNVRNRRGRATAGRGRSGTSVARQPPRRLHWTRYINDRQR